MGILNLTDSVQVSYRARYAPRDILNLFKSLSEQCSSRPTCIDKNTPYSWGAFCRVRGLVDDVRTVIKRHKGCVYIPDLREYMIASFKDKV